MPYIHVVMRLGDQANITAYGTVTIDNCIRFRVVMRKYLNPESGKVGAFISYPRRYLMGKWEDAVHPDKELHNLIIMGVVEAVKREIIRDIHLPEPEVVRITLTDPIRGQGKGKVAICGIATIKICGLTIKGIMIKRGEKGMFCNMPQYHNSSGYKDMVYGTTKDVQDKITEAVLNAYQETAEAEKKKVGHVPKPDTK